MAAAAARPEPQTAIDELVVDDDLLEQALEGRERAKDAARKARKTFESTDEQARTHVSRLERELGEGPVRVGRFVLELKTAPARAVSFETDPKERIAIRLAK